MAKAASVKTGQAPKTAAAANKAKATPDGAAEGTKPAPAAVKTKTEVAIIMPSKKAMQTEIGARVAQNLADVYLTRDRLSQEKAENERKEYDTLAQMTMAIVKCAETDAHIAETLSDVFSGDQKKINALNEILQIAMGIREVQTIQAKDGGPSAQKVVYSKAVWEIFPTPNDKGTPDEKRKNTLRSNFLHQLKKAIQAAYGIRESNITAKVDKKSGTLMLEGPAVKKHFGKDSVLLDEKQKITTGEGDNKQVTELKARPSFTEIARIGATKAGAAVVQRKDSRANVVGNASTAIVSITASLVKALESYKGEYTDEIKKALVSAGNAINTFVESKTTKAAA